MNQALVKEVRLEADPAPAALVPADPNLVIATLVKELAANPAVDVAKLAAIVALQERILDRSAEAEFNAAMASAQAEMRPVAADADNPQTRSRYASYAALDKALRPIYTRHGFGLSFDTGDAPAETVRVLCYVTHNRGGARTYRADMPADGKGAKGGDVMTKTHAAGAAMSYGMRYLLKMIFNVAVGEDDRDGNGPAAPVTDPAGFENFMADMETVAAEQGLDALQAAWKKTTATFREHTFKHYRAQWEKLKRQAATVGGVK